jgi:hypothetical protein
MDEVDRLLEALRDESSYSRLRAAVALRQIRDARVVEPLVKVLKDQDSDVRRVATVALGEIGDARAVEPLIEVLKDEYSHVRYEVALALGKVQKQLSTITKEKAACVLCSVCFCRFTEHKAHLGSGEGFRYYACRKCHSSKFIDNVTRVIAVLDDSLGKPYFRNDTTLLVNWFSCREPFDFDEIRIKHASDFDLAEIRKQLPDISKEKSASTICPACFCRFTEHKVQLGFRKSFSYYACHNCYGLPFMDNVNRVVAVLDRTFDKPCLQDGTILLANWYSKKEPFDFDEIRIIDANDFDIDELVMKLKKDMDEKRRKKYKSIPVCVSPQVQLSQAQMHMLKDTFGSVERKE